MTTTDDKEHRVGFSATVPKSVFDRLQKEADRRRFPWFDLIEKLITENCRG